MRSSLFVKIFLGFWLVTIAVLGSWMLVNQYLDTLPFADQQAAPPPPEAPPRRMILRLIYSLQNAPLENLPLLITTASQEHGVSIWLLDRRGNDLLQRPVPEDVVEVAGELRGGRRQAFGSGGDERLIAHTIYREDGRLRLVIGLPPPRHRLLGVLGANPWLRLLIAVLVSGLVCYGLSRLVTVRLRAVGKASRQLADGDLHTRIRVRERGGDETDALARDFNVMAEQLEGRIQAQKRLLSDVSHELRSPLARLRVALALAMDAPAKRGDYLERMELDIERLEELIGQLLTSQQGTITLDSHIDLVELLRRLCDDASFEGASQGKRVSLHTTLDEALVASHADLLQKCFDNMIRNALRHTAQDSEVTVSLAQEGSHFRVCVEDRGPGVPEAELSRIFDEFYRVDTARTREHGGYGLGLTIARRAIEQHGGSLHAENTGSGLRLVVTLPTDT
ncbi:HAMP domain-containing protein [Mangrovimicrobium sediminis]|uniref:histidine kinase n=1 Tax=Mangrovimicrobium sediminis TaxID=2562682 RepID=A0A4Z0M5C3_9GAMM|nr:ATP-binding protein [Haliea sp. SAOS-164]TGD74684.1 HAMP domain-containing protein [Haliea sp. SAOS-164]